MAYIILFACASACPVFFWRFAARENEAAQNLISDWRTGHYGKVCADLVTVVLVSGVLTFFIGGIAIVVGGGLGQMVLESSSRTDQQRFGFAVQIVFGFLWMLTAIIMVAQAALKSDSQHPRENREMNARDDNFHDRDLPLIDKAQFIFPPVDRILNDAHMKASQAYSDIFSETHDVSYARLHAALKNDESSYKPNSEERKEGRRKVIQDFVGSISQHMSAYENSKMLSDLLRADDVRILGKDLFLDVFAHAFTLYRLTPAVANQLRNRWDELSRLDDQGHFVHSAIVRSQIKKEFAELVHNVAPSVVWHFDDSHGLIVVGPR